MRANDHPDTRIKAADAKAVHDGIGAIFEPKVMEQLRTLRQERGFNCLGVIHFYGGVFKVEGVSDDFTGEDILRDYLTHAARQSDGVVRQRTGSILIGIHSDGMAEVATYGVSRTDCYALGEWGGRLLKDLSAVPFQTWWGWGVGGKPKPLTAEEMRPLSVPTREWVRSRTRPARWVA